MMSLPRPRVMDIQGPYVPLIRLVLLVSSSCFLATMAHGKEGETQTFETAVSIMCSAPSHCVQCQDKTGYERQSALADFIFDRVTNTEFLALFEKLAEVSLSEGQQLLSNAIERAKIVPCQFIEDAKTWKDPLLAPAKPVAPKTASGVQPEHLKSIIPNSQLNATAHPAVLASNAILTAIAAQDAVGIQLHFNEINRKKIKQSQIPRLLTEARKQTQSIRQTTELRRAPKFLGPQALLAKIRVQGDEVFVLVLTLEKGQYRFEDINSPSTSQFNGQPLVWKAP